MAIELGAAYVSILPSTNELAKPLTDAFKNSEAPVTKAADGMWSKVSGALSSTLKVGAIATGAAAVGVIGTALTKGFSRLQGIDEARAKLSGLGHEAGSVDAIMQNALASVSGTAFGLAEAGTVAASAVASGVKPGEDLERTLKLVGDAATIAGVDMGSMGDIFNKVAAKNKVTGDVINQLGSQGIPILQLLGEEMGKTAEEVSDMVSKGEVDFDIFRNAIENGMGGAALKSGETFSGALKNVGAALGRVGAAFLGPAFAQGAGIFQNLIGVIDKLSPAAKQLGEIVGGWLADAMAKVTSLFSGGSGAFGRLGEVFMELAPKVMEIVRGFSPLSLIFEAVKPLLPTIADLFTRIGEALLRLAPPILEVVQVVNNALITVLGKLIEAVMPALIKIFDAVVPVLEKIAPVIMPIVNILADLLMPIIEALLPVVETVFNAIADIISAAMTVVQGVITVVTGLIEGDWSKVWEGIKGIFIGIWDAIVAVVKGVWETIKALFFAALDILKSVWDSTWAAIKHLFSDVWNAIVSAAGNFFNSVKTKFTQVMDFIGSIPGKILGFFKGIGTWLLDSGKALIQGFIDGITAAFSWAKDKVSEGLGAIRDLFPFSPAKEGPFSGRGWVAYSGASIGATFTNSLVDSLAEGRRDIASELAGVHGEFNDFSASGQAGFSLSSALPALVDSARRVVVRIGSRDFEGWIDERADGRIAEVLPSRSSVRMSLPV